MEFSVQRYIKINPCTAGCEYFASCIIKNIPPEINSGENATHIMKITEAAYRSYKERKIITV